jgi:hypothetical protein
MLVQQRYRECEQMLGLLEVAVLQLDTRYRQAKVSLSTSVEGLAGYLEAQPESAELVLQARRVGLLR